MKKTILVMTLFLCCISTKAQLSTSIDRNMVEESPSEYECLYEYTINRVGIEGDTIHDNAFTILQIGKTLSKFEDYTAFQFDSIRNVDAHMEDVERYASQFCGTANYFDAEVFQNPSESKMTQMECMGLAYYTYDEKFAPMTWEFSEDTLTVCGYLCKKATTEYGGRKWIAWYTSELPMPNGPWKLSGLPGLILQANDSAGIHKFSAFSFRKAKMPILKIKTVNINKVTREDFIKIKALFVKRSNPLFGLGKGVSKVVALNIKQGDKNAFVVNDIIQHYNPHYIPLELK